MASHRTATLGFASLHTAPHRNATQRNATNDLPEPRVDPATSQDVKDIIKGAIDELKLHLVTNERSWIKWILGIQVAYAIAITVAFVAANIK